MKIKQYTSYFPYAVFIIALLSSITSLFFSEILKLTPCVLCWYQRIFMYPIAIIAAINIMRKHADIHYYILPFSISGLLIALYQNLLVWHIIPEQIAPCTAGVSCVEQPLILFGFVTIPLGSFFSFALITAVMVLYAKFGKENANSNSHANRKTIKQTLRK